MWGFFFKIRYQKKLSEHKDKDVPAYISKLPFSNVSYRWCKKCIDIVKKYKVEISYPPKNLPTCNFSKFIFSFLWHVCIVEASQILHNFWASSWDDIINWCSKSLVGKKLDSSFRTQASRNPTSIVL